MSLLARSIRSRAAIKSALGQSWTCRQCVQQTARRCMATVLSQLFQARPVPVDNAPPGAQQDDKILRRIFDSPDFWRDFSLNSRHGYGGPNKGLVQNRYLRDARGFGDFAARSLENAKRVVEKVMKASSVKEYKAIVKDLDRLSDMLCRVIDLCDFIRATHPDRKIQIAANNAYAKMFEYMNILNTNPGLFDQLCVALRTPEVVASWSEEEVRVADILRRDFLKSAINLTQAERDRFVGLSQEISEIGNAFTEYLGPAKRALTFDSSKLRGMDPTAVREITQRGRVTLPTVSGIAGLALRTVHDEDTRRQIFMASRTASPKALDLLAVLLDKRLELAKLSGYGSWGHLSLEDKMAKNPESVNQFLQALAEDNKPVVEQEVATLFKAKLADASASRTPLQPWDKDYYIAQVLSSARSKSRHPDFLSSYFSLGTVMQGFSRLATRLYGIRFVPRETTPGETWNHDVRRLDIISETDGHVGVLYCDLFSRPDKSPNPAHFTLRCSREITGLEVEEAASSPSPLFHSPEEAANDGMAISKSSGKLMQLPTIALICDFATINPKSTQPSLLSFNEVLTLFHEMGHALHSFIGRTTLQNVSGTRCATDFAELPSILMESFVPDQSSLELFARHYETDQPLPYTMILEKLALDKRFEGSDVESQILHSMMDQKYHSDAPLDRNFNTTQEYLNIQNKYGVLPADPPGTSWQGMFGHLYGYGSTYYSYLFDRVLAKRIWQIVFSSGQGGASLDRANGEKMKESILKFGGAKDPWKMLADVLGDERVEHGGEKAMAVVGGWGAKPRRVSAKL